MVRVAHAGQARPHPGEPEEWSRRGARLQQCSAPFHTHTYMLAAGVLPGERSPPCVHFQASRLIRSPKRRMRTHFHNLRERKLHHFATAWLHMADSRRAATTMDSRRSIGGTRSRKRKERLPIISRSADAAGTFATVLRFGSADIIIASLVIAPPEVSSTVSTVSVAHGCVACGGAMMRCRWAFHDSHASHTHTQRCPDKHVSMW